MIRKPGENYQVKGKLETAPENQERLRHKANSNRKDLTCTWCSFLLSVQSKFRMHIVRVTCALDIKTVGKGG